MTSATTTVTFSLSATSITPLLSGTGGGVLVTISGQGFDNTTKVLIDNINCPIQTFTFYNITCLTPANVRK